jgi:hypothetical protein
VIEREQLAVINGGKATTDRPITSTCVTPLGEALAAGKIVALAPVSPSRRRAMRDFTPEALAADIYEIEHDERPKMQLALDMRKTYLRSEVLKTGKLSATIGDFKVTLKIRSLFLCECHGLQIKPKGRHPGCNTPLDELRIVQKKIDDPAHRDVVVKRVGEPDDDATNDIGGGAA